MGERIRRAREAKGISASELARKAEVTPTAVWNWEQNQIAPRAITMKKVAACLGVSEEFLRTGTGQSDHKSTTSTETKDVSSIASLLEETRAKIAHATGFTLDRVKLHLELVAE